MIDWMALSWSRRAAAFSKRIFLGGLFHFLLQTGDNLFAVPLQEVHQVRDHLAVLGLGRRADAGGDAQLDVIVQARPQVGAGDLPVAGQEREDLPQDVQSLVDSPGGGIRPKVARAILHHLAGDRHLGEWLSPVDLDIRIALVVLEPDVVLRPVLLDQVHLEDERLQLRADDDPLKINDIPYEPARLGVMTGIRMEVGADAVPQVDRLAHVDDRRLGILHDVQPGLAGRVARMPWIFSEICMG